MDTQLTISLLRVPQQREHIMDSRRWAVNNRKIYITAEFYVNNIMRLNSLISSESSQNIIGTHCYVLDTGVLGPSSVLLRCDFVSRKTLFRLVKMLRIVNIAIRGFIWFEQIYRIPNSFPKMLNWRRTNLVARGKKNTTNTYQFTSSPSSESFFNRIVTFSVQTEFQLFTVAYPRCEIRTHFFVYVSIVIILTRKHVRENIRNERILKW